MEIREKLSKHFGDDLLFADSFDTAIIGVSLGVTGGRVVYDVEKMVQVLSKKQGITCEEASEKLNDDNTHFIDVRNEDEYNSGHITGSIWIPVDQFMQSIDKIPETGNLYFICAAGARSGLACEFSASLSIDEERLFNIYEGMPTWISKGLPSEQGL